MFSNLEFEVKSAAWTMGSHERQDLMVGQTTVKQQTKVQEMCNQTTLAWYDER
jgi:hypothetical protein